MNRKHTAVIVGTTLILTVVTAVVWTDRRESRIKSLYVQFHNALLDLEMERAYGMMSPSYREIVGLSEFSEKWGRYRWAYWNSKKRIRESDVNVFNLLASAALVGTQSSGPLCGLYHEVVQEDESWYLAGHFEDRLEIEMLTIEILRARAKLRTLLAMIESERHPRLLFTRGSIEALQERLENHPRNREFDPRRYGDLLEESWKVAEDTKAKEVMEHGTLHRRYRLNREFLKLLKEERARQKEY